MKQETIYKETFNFYMSAKEDSMRKLLLCSMWHGVIGKSSQTGTYPNCRK